MLAVHKSTLSAARCAHRRNFVPGTTSLSSSSSLSPSSRRETSHGSRAPSRFRAGETLRQRQTSLLNRDVSIRLTELWKSPCVLVKRQKERESDLCSRAVLPQSDELCVSIHETLLRSYIEETRLIKITPTRFCNSSYNRVSKSSLLFILHHREKFNFSLQIYIKLYK